MQRRSSSIGKRTWALPVMHNSGTNKSSQSWRRSERSAALVQQPLRHRSRQPGVQELRLVSPEQQLQLRLGQCQLLRRRRSRLKRHRRQQEISEKLRPLNLQWRSKRRDEQCFAAASIAAKIRQTMSVACAEIAHAMIAAGFAAIRTLITQVDVVR